MVGPGGITRSGRIFAQRNTVEPSAKGKGKELENDIPIPTETLNYKENRCLLRVLHLRKKLRSF